MCFCKTKLKKNRNPCILTVSTIPNTRATQKSTSGGLLKNKKEGKIFYYIQKLAT
jgi:hypothetical protein